MKTKLSDLHIQRITISPHFGDGKIDHMLVCIDMALESKDELRRNITRINEVISVQYIEDLWDEVIKHVTAYKDLRYQLEIDNSHKNNVE